MGGARSWFSSFCTHKYSSLALLSYRDLLTRHKALAAEFLDVKYDEVSPHKSKIGSGRISFFLGGGGEVFGVKEIYILLLISGLVHICPFVGV